MMMMSTDLFLFETVSSRFSVFRFSTSIDLDEENVRTRNMAERDQRAKMMPTAIPSAYRGQDQRSALEAYASDLRDFLHEHADIATMCLVEYFTKDAWRRSVPSTWTFRPRGPFDAAAYGAAIDRGDLPLSAGAGENVRRFLKRCRELSLQNVNPTCPTCADENAASHALKMGSKRKKRHEVLAMAPVVRDIARAVDAKTVFDLGSGQGHLDRALAMLYGLSVVGVEMSTHNATVASARAETLWARKDVKTRGERWRYVWSSAKAFDRKRRLRRVWRAWTGRDVVCPPARSPPPSRRRRPRNVVACANGGSVSSVAVRIDADTDLPLPPSFESKSQDDEKRAVLIGLHSCGDLSATAIRLFIKQRTRFAGLALVSCCYHLLNTHYCGARDGKHVRGPDGYENFPMSDHLAKRDTTWMRFNLLNLACHNTLTPLGCTPPGFVERRPRRSGSTFPLRLKKMWFRAMLENLLAENDPRALERVRKSGRVRWRSRRHDECAFSTYARDFMGGDALPDWSAEKLDEFESAHVEGNLRKMAILLVLRAFLAPVAEAVVLVDRALRVIEACGETCEVRMVPLFDPTISPRSVAILARRL